jgi:predicted DNA-binding ribbon-helix-helix protein
VTLRGHRTSVALEAPFWAALDLLATRRGLSVSTLIDRVDSHREAGLASAIRVMVLEAARKGELSDE